MSSASSTYWMDECYDDAIFAVFLRKVRYVSAKPLQTLTLQQYRPLNPENPEFGDHLQWETVKERVIKGGSLDRLVDCLVKSDGLFDSNHFNVFFATFRAFTTTYKVIVRILRRYSDAASMVSTADGNSKASQNTSLTLYSWRSVLVCWLETYPEDFYEFPNFTSLVQLIEFSRHHDLHSVKVKAKNLREKFVILAKQGGLKSQLDGMDLPRYERLDCLTSPNRIDSAKLLTIFCSTDSAHIAQQLTYWDAQLFKKLIPNQCLGCVWSKRSKKKEADKVYSVRATIDQFNAVSRRVMTSIVFPDSNISNQRRATVLSKWIHIARELRVLKNFSSLKAVLSSLQSEPVYRLSDVWAAVSGRQMQDFRELCSYFEDDDERRMRRLLQEEDISKTSPARRLLIHRRTKSDANLLGPLRSPQGTIPFLGTFLTDLTMIDEANSDFIEGGLVNFEKRRKEFEVLAKIKLFQSAARTYRLTLDPEFSHLFESLPSLPEKDCFTCSLLIEKPRTSTPEVPVMQKKSSGGSGLFNSTRKVTTISRMLMTMFGGDESVASVEQECIVPSSSKILDRNGGIMPRSETTPGAIAGSREGFSGHSNDQSVQNIHSSFIGSEFSPSEMFTSFVNGDWTNSSLQSSSRPDTDSLSHSSSTTDIILDCCSETLNGLKTGDSKTETMPMLGKSFSTVERQLVARVGLSDQLQEALDSNVANYKSVRIETNDRMSQFIERCLQKHHIEGDSAHYYLVQLLPNGKELALPAKCNPYYAAAPDTSGPMLNFILCSKKNDWDMGSTKHKRKRTNLLRWSSGYI